MRTGARLLVGVLFVALIDNAFVWKILAGVGLFSALVFLEAAREHGNTHR